MTYNQHQFHIPVMGTGHSIDSPIRVAHLGIHSVISIVDDLLCEKIRKHYCSEYNFSYKNISRSALDGRAERITAYLDTVADIVAQKFEEIKNMPLFEGTEKDRYFHLLPEGNMLKKSYEYIASLKDPETRQQLIMVLTDPDDQGQWKKLERMRKNLDEGMDLCLEIAATKPYPGEKLHSLQSIVHEQRQRLATFFDPAPVGV